MTSQMNEDALKQVINDIQYTTSQFLIEAPQTSNKAAARRCRKHTLLIEKLGKEYRKLSSK